jgi:hypothetical protein
MFNVNKDFSQRFFAFSLTVGLVAGTSPQAFAADSDLNLKVRQPLRLPMQQAQAPR